MGVIMLLLLYILRSKKNNALKNGLSYDIYSNEEMKIGNWHMNLNGWIIWPILMMVCYGLHAWLGSVSTQGSMDEMLRWSLLAIFALLAGMLALCTRRAMVRHGMAGCRQPACVQRPACGVRRAAAALRGHANR